MRTVKNAQTVHISTNVGPHLSLTITLLLPLSKVVDAGLFKFMGIYLGLGIPNEALIRMYLDPRSLT